MKKLIIIFAACLVVAAITAYLVTAHHKHSIVGSWEAADSTIFIFRDDGSFVGSDLTGRKIFGNWVVLNDFQIGFQSLRGKLYNPQFAEVTREGMRYIFIDGSGYISAVRIDMATALQKVSLATLHQEKENTAEQDAAANP